MPSLTLYYTDMCPFCRKVLQYLADNHIEIPMKNTMENSKNRKELFDIGGKTQVPCLVIDGKPLYESTDIIKWFEKNWKEQS